MKNWNYKNFVVHQYEELASTNSTALEKAASRQIFDGEIIMADMQNLGRGRLDRSWTSPKGNLYFSLVLQPQVAMAKIGQISFVGIVALRQAVEDLIKVGGRNIDANEYFGKSSAANINVNYHKFNVQNKWPNDLLIDRKKVAGLLLESKINQQNCEFVVLGIGVNIDSNPDNTIFSAGNLSQFKIVITPEILLQKFLDKFEILYKNWLDFGFANVRNAWLSKAYCLHEKISAKDGDDSIEGIFDGMDSDGKLILLVEDVVKKIIAADIL